MSGGTEAAVAFVGGLFLALTALAVWTSWVLRKRRDDDRPRGEV